MITVGLIAELRFISEALRTPIRATLKSERTQADIFIQIKEQVLEVWYLGYRLWNESLDDAVTMFGIESVDTIAKIIFLIDTGDTEKWRKLVFIEKS